MPAFRIIWIVFLLFGNHVYAQKAYRISGDFSIKYAAANGQKMLNMGRFYYDLNAGQVVWDMRFPHKEIWVFKDTIQYVYRNDSLLRKMKSPLITDLTIYHLSIHNDLSHYGLKNSVFYLDNVKEEDGMVISSWKASKKMKIGHLALSAKNKLLQGVIFYDTKDKILRKQFFRNYSVSNGIPFPLEIIDFFYNEAGKDIQKTTFKNILINEAGHNHLYYYMHRKP